MKAPTMASRIKLNLEDVIKNMNELILTPVGETRDGLPPALDTGLAILNQLVRIYLDYNLMEFDQLARIVNDIKMNRLAKEFSNMKVKSGDNLEQPMKQ